MRNTVHIAQQGWRDRPTAQTTLVCLCDLPHGTATSETGGISLEFSCQSDCKRCCFRAFETLGGSSLVSVLMMRFYQSNDR